jgi:hypothetical protein
MHAVGATCSCTSTRQHRSGSSVDDKHTQRHKKHLHVEVMAAASPDAGIVFLIDLQAPVGVARQGGMEAS